MSYAEPEVEGPSEITLHVTIPATSSCTTPDCSSAIPATGVDSLTAIVIGGVLFGLGVVLVARRRGDITLR